MAKTRSARRRDAAEEVCWELMIAIPLGGMDDVEVGWRKLIAEPLQKWAELIDEPWFHKDCPEECPNPLHKKGVDGEGVEEK